MGTHKNSFGCTKHPQCVLRYRLLQLVRFDSRVLAIHCVVELILYSQILLKLLHLSEALLQGYQVFLCRVYIWDEHLCMKLFFDKGNPVTQRFSDKLLLVSL